MKKKLYLLPLMVCLISVFVNKANAQTTLAPGDLSFTGFNSALGFRDGFSFVTWVNLSSGTEIKFTDDGFNSGSNSNTAGNVRALEQIFTWTSTSAIPAGTIITIEGDGVSSTKASTGTLTVSNSDGSPTPLMNLANTGDNFFAFQGSFVTNNSTTGTISGTPLFLVQYQGIGSNTGFLTSGATTTNTSYVPTDLTGYAFFIGSNAVAAEYTGIRTGLTVAQYKASINNLSNWTIYLNPNGVTTYNTTAFSLGSPPSITGQPSNRTVCSLSNTSFSVTASNATSYQWQVNTGSGFTDIAKTSPYSTATTSSLTITAVTAGMNGYTYRCNVINAQGTTTSNSSSLTVSSVTASASSQTNIACNGGSTGAATVSVTGGSSPYTYSWSPSGGTAATATGLTAGSYTCTVTDNIGCQGTRSFTITQPSAITASTSQTNVACNGGSNGSASVTVSGGTPSYTYSWSPSGGTTATTTGRTAGAYTCTITDANGCTATKNFAITQPTAITATTSQTNVSCNGGSNGSASVTASGGAGAYTYSWSPSGGTGATATGLTPGAYTCTITDANSCTSTKNFIITQPTAITATTSQTNVACNGGSNGTASVTPSGGAGSYTYSWSPSGGTGATATGLTPGAYTCTITDANSCTSTKNFTITQPTAITASTSQTNISCNGGSNGSASVTVSGGAGAYTYSWSPSGGTAATATGLSAGTYICSITDANACTITKTFIITQPTALTATASSQTNIACNGGSTGAATVLASGGTAGYTYSWSPSGGTAATTTGRSAGIYTCTVTDANGCTATRSFTITQPAVLNVVASSQTNNACNGGSAGAATVSVSGGAPGYTYSWSPSGGTAATATGLAAGGYLCTVTDANGCTNTQSFAITQPTSIVATVSSQTNIACNGGSTGAATLTVSGGAGGYTYSWSPSGGATASITGRTAGVYTCTVTDANACTATRSVTLTQPTALVATASSQTNIACNGGSNGAATVLAGGGTPFYTYSWSPTGGTAATATGISAGTYTCTVTDAYGCSAARSFTITQPTALTATASSQTNIACNGGSTGAATVLASGGTAGYTYSWSPSGGTAATTTGRSAGVYTCTVTDANGCTATRSFTITQPSAITATISQTNVACNGGSNGAASVTASGGAGAYTYSWSPSGGTASSATGLAAGAYTCTITDANACTITKNFTITQPFAIIATTAQTNIACNGGSTGAATVTASGGAGGYTYSWSPSGGTAASATGLAAGTYTCTITDANACTIIKNFTITQAGFTAGTSSYTLPSTNQSVTKPVSSGNYVTSTCELISTVAASGAHPVTGNASTKVWIESSVPKDGAVSFVQRHYEITPAANATTSTGTVTLYFTQGDFDNFNEQSLVHLPSSPADATGKANLLITKYSGISGDGSGFPSSYGVSPTVIDPADNNIVWNATASAWEVTFDVDGFSGFIVQAVGTPVAANWSSFNVLQQGKSALLRWSTASEQNTRSFTVQHRTSNAQWNSIADIQAAGTSNSLQHYSFLHATPANGINYYRIMLSDMDGRAKYSEIKTLKLTNVNTDFTLITNPAVDGTIKLNVQQGTTLTLFSQDGKMLWKKQLVPGVQSFDMSRYAKGIYLLKGNNQATTVILQ